MTNMSQKEEGNFVAPSVIYYHAVNPVNNDIRSGVTR